MTQSLPSPDTGAFRVETDIREARAKVNVFLRVMGRRADGFHDLETLIVPISLSDRLEVRADNNPAQFKTLSLSLEVSGDPQIIRGVPADESNLVLRAAAALAERAGVRGFADVSLEKRIPAAAGLGGRAKVALRGAAGLGAALGAGLAGEGALAGAGGILAAR